MESRRTQSSAGIQAAHQPEPRPLGSDDIPKTQSLPHRERLGAQPLGVSKSGRTAYCLQFRIAKVRLTGLIVPLAIVVYTRTFVKRLSGPLQFEAAPFH
jgi:hypothetical protein